MQAHEHACVQSRVKRRVRRFFLHSRRTPESTAAIASVHCALLCWPCSLVLLDPTCCACICTHGPPKLLEFSPVHIPPSSSRKAREIDDNAFKRASSPYSLTSVRNTVASMRFSLCRSILHFTFRRVRIKSTLMEAISLKSGAGRATFQNRPPKK